MKWFNSHIMGFLSRLMKPFRERYHKNKAKRFKGPIPSIICNNCLGGIILHDLGMPFNTPTINTGIRNQLEFIYFCKHLEDMIDLPMVALPWEKYKAPAGQLIHNGFTIDVVLRHYKDFASGYEKWRQRMNRLDLNNIVVLLESPEVSPEILETFSEIKYKKAIISKPIQNKPDYYVPLDIYENWHPGKILEYKSLFSLKRWVDDWDYISFLND